MFVIVSAACLVSFLNSFCRICVPCCVELLISSVITNDCRQLTVLPQPLPPACTELKVSQGETRTLFGSFLGMYAALHVWVVFWIPGNISKFSKPLVWTSHSPSFPFKIFSQFLFSPTGITASGSSVLSNCCWLFLTNTLSIELVCTEWVLSQVK